MQEQKVSQNQLRRYVLGDLPPEEQRQIEQAYFADESLLQQIWAIFDETAEQLWQGELSTADAQTVTARVRASPYLWMRLETQYALLRAIDNLAHRPTRMARLRVLFSSRPALKWTWATAGVVVLVGSLFWLFSARQTAPQRPAPQVAQIPSSLGMMPAPSATEVISAPTPSPSPKASTATQTAPVEVARATTATFFLAQESVRSASNAARFVLPSRATTVELQIEVRPPFASHYQVEIATTDGEAVVVRPHLARQQLRELSFITLRIPAQQLSGQDYIARIQAETSSPSPQESLSFQIKKK